MGNFRWIGDSVESVNFSSQKHWFKYYQAFIYKQVKFHVGDFIVVRQKGKCYVGKLTHLFHSFEKRHTSKQHRGIVQVYKKVKDLDFHIIHSYPMLNEDYEIIETSTNLANTICLEEIIEKCVITFAEIDDPLFQCEQNVTYCCRYRLERNKLLPVLNNIDIKENIKLCANSPKNTTNYEYKRKLSIRDDTDTDTNLMSPSRTMHLTPDKVRSPVSPSKTVKLTPEYNFHEQTLSKSVKRVLADSFDEDLNNVCYSVKNLQCDDAIKMTIEVVSGNNIKVFPTKLTQDIMSLKSPIKVSSFKEVNNKIELSEVGKVELQKKNMIDENSSTQQQIPAKISLRRSTRTVERKSYVENRLELKENIDSVHSVRRSKRVTSTPKRYLDDTEANLNSFTKSKESVRLEMKASKFIYQSPPKRLNGEAGISTRPKRLIKTPIKYSEETCENVPKTRLNEEHGTSTKSRRLNTARNSEESTQKKYDDSDDYVSEKEISRKNLFKSSSKPLNNERIEMKTPKRSMTNSSISTKDTPTIRARMVRAGTITPSVQDRKMGILKDNTPLSNARNKLHVSYLPQALACREKEFQDIANFLEGKLLDGCGGCMYISGVPGTGKTATVTDVMKTLQESAKKKLVPAFKYININGMKISEPRQAYVEIAKQLIGKTIRWDEAQSMLENTFVNSKRKTSIIMVVDELDLLCTKRQDVVYTLLDWPTRTNAHLIVITIANTMDLPERLLMGRVTSRLGLTRLTFQPYTYKQLQEIVTKRIMGTESFNPDAVQLVARKVASVSGDARRALDICRRAAEIAETEGKYTLVSISHVNQALNAMITQPKVLAIKLCCRLEKLLLQSVVAEVERTGVEETNFTCVYRMLATVAALDGFQMVPRSTAMRSLASLGASRFLLIDNKCNNIYNQRIMLNISSDDVHYALSNIVI